VQTAVDRKHTRMIATDVSHETGDRDWRSPMALQAKAGRGGACDAVAAVGDYHGEEGKPCLAAGLTPYVTRPRTSAHQQRGLFSKADRT
jgi:transposase